MNQRLTDEQLLYLLRQVDIQAMRIPSGVRRLADLICEKILSEVLPDPDTTSEAGYTSQALRDYGAYREDEGYKRGKAERKVEMSPEFSAPYVPFDQETCVVGNWLELTPVRGEVKP